MTILCFFYFVFILNNCLKYFIIFFFDKTWEALGPLTPVSSGYNTPQNSHPIVKEYTLRGAQ